MGPGTYREVQCVSWIFFPFPSKTFASICLFLLVVSTCSLLLPVGLDPDEEEEREEEEERKSEDVSRGSVAAIESVSILAENFHHMMLHGPVCQPERPTRVWGAWKCYVYTCTCLHNY